MGIKAKIKKLLVPENITYCKVQTIVESDSLKDEVIMITGGGSGIGKAVAKRAVAAKAQVIIVGRREELLREVCKEIGIENCKYYVYDVLKADGKNDVFYEIEKIFNKKVTALVNNAGIYIEKGIENFTVDDFDKTIATNLRAPIFLTVGFVKYCKSEMIKGNIVMTASNRGLFGDHGPYGISKKGLIHYVEGIAKEVIEIGIRVNAVAPGMTASEINGIGVNENMYNSMLKGKRVLMPEEIAEVICFLLSRQSNCINGATIPCDEGEFLR